MNFEGSKASGSTVNPGISIRKQDLAGTPGGGGGEQTSLIFSQSDLKMSKSSEDMAFADGESMALARGVSKLDAETE